MEYDYDIYLLSQKFMNDYPFLKYPELMYKSGRLYNCLLIDTHYDYFTCVPYRSYINHKMHLCLKVRNDQKGQIRG